MPKPVKVTHTSPDEVNYTRSRPRGVGNGKPQPGSKSTYREFKGEYISPALTELKGRFSKHYYYSDDNVIEVVLGAVAGNSFQNDPLWLYLIGPPSSGKTELLMSTFDCEETYFLSDLTSSSLISGYKDPPEGKTKKKGKKAADEAPVVDDDAEQPDDAEPAADEDEPAKEEEDYSLLPKLDGKVLVIKDFTLIHDKPADARSQILAQLRDAYDGFSSRKIGNSHTKGFHSKFNLLAGMTPDIEKSWSLNTLGERFLMYRIHVEDRRQHTRMALDAVRGKSAGSANARPELQEAVKTFLDGLDRFVPEVDDAMAEKIIDLAEVLATARTYVHREKNDDMPCLPVAEMASRVAKQLLRVGMSVALVRARRKVTDDEFAVMKRIALDSLPTNRRLLLEALWKGEPDKFYDLKHFAEQVSRISKNTVRRELNNLAELGVAECMKEPVAENSSKQKADGTQKKFVTTRAEWRLSETFRKYGVNIGGI